MREGIQSLVRLVHGLHRWPRESFSLRVQWGDAPPVRLSHPLLRYHADPFVIARDGQVHVFFEEFDYLACRGRIAAMRLEEGTSASKPVVVLERPYHLSYPFLIEEDGHLFMIPESSQDRGVDLYRCEEFPTRWRLERRLLHDVDAADTTVLRRGDRTWLFTSVHDAVSEPGRRHLCIFHAGHLLADAWTAHPVNSRRLYGDLPHSSGRCAGSFIHHANRWLRPAQHNPHHYGQSLRFHEVALLTTSEFEETILPAPPQELADMVGLGIHHLSSVGRVTVADVRDRTGCALRCGQPAPPR